MSHNWVFDLNGPGMIPLHRAGLTGLLASLKQLEKFGELLPNWEYEVRGNILHLPNMGTDSHSIAELLRGIYRIDKDGLMDFPLYRNTTIGYKVHVQQVLLGTFIQHPQSRKTAKQMEKQVYQVGDEQHSINFLPIYDFSHRSLSAAEEVSDAIRKNQYIDVKGWAFPGGMVRHNAFSKNTALQDTPERYLLLLAAPLGCLYFQSRAYLVNGDFDPKTQYVLAIPRPAGLSWFTDRLIRLYHSMDEQKSHLYVSGESDAALLSALMFLLDRTAFRLDIDFQAIKRGQLNFQVMRFGTAGWSKQQKTRTGVISTTVLKTEMIETYLHIDQYLKPRERKTQQGDTFIDVMPMRNRIAENLIRERPWYSDFAEYVSDARRKKVKSWRKELSQLIKDLNWSQETKRRFVDLVQAAVRNRYGRVSSEAKSVGANVGSLLDREYDRMVLTFSKCRTKENFREELFRFLAVNRAKLKELSPQERIDMLLKVAVENDWKEARDLCLLAIVTYSGKEKDEEETENLNEVE